jgi:hypothetical protein
LRPLVKPQVKAVQNPDGKKYCTGYQKPPHSIGEAGKDVRQPCKQTHNSNNGAHKSPD